MNSLEKRTAFAATMMKLSYIGFLMTLTLGTWVWVQEGRQPSMTIWIIRVVPMLMFAHAVFKSQLRGIAWMCFASLLYFVMAVTEALSSLAIWFNYVELAMVVILFCSATVFIRWQAALWREVTAQRNETV
ncbi:DUF2069 domain-containing protein [Zhongshania aliphaticivorans]|uniref:DUF2069 domain-containing protein n=1 Tax=Zhongshania aliphaticivorans TaxID=1470434 RepID=UPI0012E6B6A4|nr:DUF2069 domain-containing protein [Zhongshania aliphaticivorans]CAA0102269.1 Uncharacterised protein [Zhongshania aliphaticivorans]